MTVFVVDTNVPVVANGGHPAADARCRLTCVERLKTLATEEIIAIDEGGLIFEEYRRNLNLSGMPGVGDAFLKHVFNHQYREERVRRVAVRPSENDGRGYEALPENTLDRADRKFLAVAVVARAIVLNATDSDWNEQTALLTHLRVQVRQLCPQRASKAARRGR